MTLVTQVLNNFQKIWCIRENQPAWFQIYLFEEPSSADLVLLLLLVNEATRSAWVQQVIFLSSLELPASGCLIFVPSLGIC